ncbi:double-strand-break repair protein rad21 homolog A-like isoform X2 [Corythoichthys intestinalis]|uniref:double-strand-break repair protein rad21 homolog A-like isoform X2 n=1 Tax=Corythoichthys intestinalis TaxID=161448 RepID=UPI0025A59CB7|nr:double-strand-break repair protein rad21 homolog A-like isoform X2 [Corythoichthys intestinalis]
MFNCWTSLLSKYQSLNHIWLSVHWKQKLTKTHVVQCDLQTAIEDIVTSPQMFGLRISGSLLLGMAQIFSRKVKYLLTDCNQALAILKVSFRTVTVDGQCRSSYEGLEVCVEEIPLWDDLSFLPDLSSDNITRDFFSQNQSRPEDITLKEFSDNTYQNEIFQSAGQPQDFFGDEGTGLASTLDLLTDIDVQHLDLGLMENPDETCGQDASLDQQPDVNRREIEKEKSLSPQQQPSFVLPPMPDTVRANKRGKRKCKLIVDQITTLSDEAMRLQLRDDSDLVIGSPPIRRLAYWKENTSAFKLLTRPCSDFLPMEILEAFPKDVSPQTIDEIWCGHSRGGSSVGSESLTDLSPELLRADIPDTSDKWSDSEILQVMDHTLDLSNSPELPPVDLVSICPSLEEQRSQKLQGDSPFSLAALCSGSSRWQVARTFQSLLILHNRGAVTLSQSAPYQDIFAAPGPTFFTWQ